MSTDAGRLGGWGRLLGKSLLMPAVASPLLKAPTTPPSGRVLTAQACSWVGDIALVGRSRPPFLLGLGSFLAAHLAYISAYRQRSSTPVLATAGRRRLLVAGTAASVAMAAVAGRKDPVVAVPVAAYGVALASMVATAAAVDADRGRSRVLGGACLFLVSDTLIGVRRFLADDRGRALEAAIMTTYATGQWLICDGMRRG
jgi:uncharacterized membrane protein YhhN